MPLASPPGRPDVVYGFGRIDASGRVADRMAITALGWRGGDRLTLTAEAGVMIARRDPGGMVTVPARPYVVIPAALRRRCGLRAGDHVLLAASPGQDPVRVQLHAALPPAAGDHLVDPGSGQRPTVVHPQPQLRPPRLRMPRLDPEVAVQQAEHGAAGQPPGGPPVNAPQWQPSGV